MSSTPTQSANAGLPNEPQVIPHLQGVVNRNLGPPADSLPDGQAADLASSQGIQNLNRSLLVVEEVVVGAEEC